MSTPTFINVASLVPDQHHCNLKLRVLSVEAIAETIHPETGKIIQSAEAIVGDETACILLNLKNDQVNLLARNARLQVLNANVNMYRGFMRLEVNEDEEANNSNSGDEHLRPSITAIMDEDDEDEQDSLLSRDGDKMVATTSLTTANYPRSLVAQAAHAAAAAAAAVAAAAAPSSSSAARPAGLSSYNAGGVMTTVAAAASSMSTATIASGSSSNSLASTASSSSSFSSRDQMEIEMRLGTGGSVPLMEYYRTIEFTYFSTVEPVGR
ncbi:hypothetical protein EC991_007570 [Linnemannia zychae]|nr:hypothetical protein EC991_007570 [Linnemannia zychae]